MAGINKDDPEILFNFTGNRRRPKKEPEPNSLGIKNHSEIWAKFAAGLSSDDIKAGTKASAEWYRQKLKELKTVNTNQLMTARDRLRQTGIPGQMYIFFYDAKFKNDAKKLPYWDRVPCVLILEKDKDSFLSLNLHYLRVRDRLALLQKLYSLATGPLDNEQTKLRLSYQTIKGVARYATARRCIKRHLFSHIKSRLLWVPAQQYDLAALLPIARWERKTAEYVYQDGAKNYATWSTTKK